MYVLLISLLLYSLDVVEDREHVKGPRLALEAHDAGEKLLLRLADCCLSVSVRPCMYKYVG